MSNVYADLGQIFAHSNMAEPRVAAYMLGIMIKGMGADHVVWGTDALWTGSPQWQIEALRRMEIPDEHPEEVRPRADGSGRRPGEDARSSASNNARLYGYTPKMWAALEDDKLAVLQGDVREARRRAHQPRLRLRQQGLSLARYGVGDETMSVSSPTL